MCLSSMRPRLPQVSRPLSLLLAAVLVGCEGSRADPRAQAAADIRATMRALETGDGDRFCAGLTPRLAAGWTHHIALIADNPDLDSCPDTFDTDAVEDLDDDLLSNLRSYQPRVVLRGNRGTAYSTVPGEAEIATPIVRRDGRWLIDAS